jgi:hypothetical protein
MYKSFTRRCKITGASREIFHFFRYQIQGEGSKFRRNSGNDVKSVPCFYTEFHSLSYFV